MMGWKKSVGYAVGDLGINLYFISSMTFLLYFYTDVLEISAAAAAGTGRGGRVLICSRGWRGTSPARAGRHRPGHRRGRRRERADALLDVLNHETGLRLLRALDGRGRGHGLGAARLLIINGRRHALLN